MVKGPVLSGSCPVCNEPAKSRCSACYATFYCGAQHQKENWKEHKLSCQKPYTIEKNEECGRYIVALRDLNPGDIVLREKPIVTGPNLDNASDGGSLSEYVCLGCYASLQQHTFHPCRKCKAPLCGKECEESPSHIEECTILKQNPIVFYSAYHRGALVTPNKSTFVKQKPELKSANYQLILPIRVMLLKKNDLKKYRKFMALQSHAEDRAGTQTETTVREKVVRLLEHYKLLSGELCVDANVQGICGIFDTNSFDLSVPEKGVSVTAVFGESSMMMHSCYKNTRLTYSKEAGMTIMARQPIKKGEAIYHSYAREFTTTTFRRLILYSGKHFGCECVRCLDPSEMGSYCSALLCAECFKHQDKNSIVTCENSSPVVPENPIDLESVWKCTKCASVHILAGHQVAALERQLSMELESITKTDIRSLEEFVSRHVHTLYPTHGSLMVAKQLLSVGYGRFPGFERDKLSKKQLARKLSLCREVLKVSEIVETGIATKIGLAAYELGSVLVWIMSKNASVSINPYKLEAIKCFEKASEILSFDPPGSNNVIVGGQAAKAMENIKAEMAISKTQTTCAQEATCIDT